MTTFIVTSTGDTTDPDDGLLTLREAIAAANGTVDADLITFDPAIFADPATITLGGAELAITGSVTITGPEAGLTVDADDASRVFAVSGAGTAVAMTGLTITGGAADSGAGVLVGADSSLSLRGVTVEGNEATAGIGGGIENAGTLSMSAVTISGNTASTHGGGIANAGTIDEFVNVTIAGNAATAGDGGGVHNAGTATLVNATVWGNTAGNDGGGVLSASGALDVVNSIVVGNTGGLNPNIAAVSSTTGSVIDAPEDEVFAPVDTDEDGTADAIALADNGGPVRTLRLLPSKDNTAIDLIADAEGDAAPEVDATGTARPQNGGNDAGAFELQYETPTATDDAGAVTEGATTTIGNGSGVLSNDEAADPSKNLEVTAIAGGSVGGGVDGVYGDLTLNPDGSYSYVANDAEGLRAGETVDDAFTYTVAEDGNFTSTATLTITVTGENDAPVAADVAASAEDIGAEDGVDVLATVTDADAGDTLAVKSAGAAGDAAEADVDAGSSIAVMGAYGTLTIASDGAASYEVDAAKAAPLGDGATGTDTFTFTAVDGAGAEARAGIVVSVEGTNDDPVATDLTVDAAEADPEDGATVMGNVTDVDDGDTLTVRAVVAGAGADASAGGFSGTAEVVGTHGTLTISEGGGFSYSVDAGDADVVALGEGATAEDVFSFLVADDAGTPGTAAAELAITVTGTNDAPTASPATSAAAAAAPGAVPAARLTFGDPDGDGTAAVTRVAFDAVADGDDNEDEVTADEAGVAVGAHGTLTIDADGTYTYVESGPAIEDVTDSFDVTVTDDRGERVSTTISIDVAGVGHAPDAEDDAVTAAAAAGGGDVLANDGDVDGQSLAVSAIREEGGSDVSTFPAEIGTGNGRLNIASDGSYTYVRSAAAEADENGVLDVFEYTVTDGTNPVTATLTIFAGPRAADDPVAAADAEDGDGANALANDSELVSTGGTLRATAVGVSGDEAGPERISEGVDGVVAGSYGTLTMKRDGSYAYAAGGAAFDALKAADTREDAFDYAMADGAGGTSVATITVSVTGVNDGPVARNDAATAGAIARGASLLANDSDLDGDALAVGTVAATPEEGGTADPVAVAAAGTMVEGTYGFLTVTPDGSYDYEVKAAAVGAIEAGTTVEDSFDYTAVDGMGGSAPARLVVSVEGTMEPEAPTPPVTPPVTPPAEPELPEPTAGDDALDGTRGSDVLRGRTGDDTIRGGAGSDALRGDKGDDRLIGGGDDDILLGGSGEDDLRGQKGDDLLFGGRGDDRLRAGVGEDRMIGGRGDDKLYGGEGADTFVFGAGLDRIRRFDASEDTLELTSSLWEGELTAAEVIEEFGRDKGPRLVLRFDGDNIVKIYDRELTLDQLAASIEIV